MIGSTTATQPQDAVSSILQALRVTYCSEPRTDYEDRERPIYRCGCDGVVVTRELCTLQVGMRLVANLADCLPPGATITSYGDWWLHDPASCGEDVHLLDMALSECLSDIGQRLLAVVLEDMDDQDRDDAMRLRLYLSIDELDITISSSGPILTLHVALEATS